MIIDLRILIRYNNIIILLFATTVEMLANFYCKLFYYIFISVLKSVIRSQSEFSNSNKEDPQVLIGGRWFSRLDVHDFPWFVYLVNDNVRVTYEYLFYYHRTTSAELYNSRYIEFSGNKSMFHQTCTTLPNYNLIYLQFIQIPIFEFLR